MGTLFSFKTRRIEIFSKGDPDRELVLAKATYFNSWFRGSSAAWLGGDGCEKTARKRLTVHGCKHKLAESGRIHRRPTLIDMDRQSMDFYTSEDVKESRKNLVPKK